MSVPERGDHRIDKERESAVLVLEACDTTANQYKTGQYSWDKSELTVSDYEANEDYPETDSVVMGVYLESLSDFVDDMEDVAPEEAESIIDEQRAVQQYAFPVSRLKEE